MSRSVRGPDYRRHNLVMYQCYECATTTPDPPVDGVALCHKHRDSATIQRVQDAVNSEFITRP